MRGGSPIDNFNFLYKYKLIITILILFLCVSTTSAVVTQYNSTNGPYTVVIFNGTGSTTWTAPSCLSTIEYLIVGGGGAGSGGFSGGGGAGGMLNASGLYVAPGSSHTIVVGAGGTGYNYAMSAPSGGNSAFDALTAIGGGGGGEHHYGNASGGGSGGGGASNDVGGNRSGGDGVAGQGHKGGDAIGAAWYYSSGGGGGAGEDGSNGRGTLGAWNPDSFTGGDGGDGLRNNITGVLTYYAGGGGGGAYYDGANGSGGLGGGAPGGYGSNGTDGLGGGGGGAYLHDDYAARLYGTGGSGVVILKYITPPVSIFRVSENSGFNGYVTYNVAFIDSSTGSPTSWNWSFGDGSYSNSSNSTVHSYSVAGNYTVNLTTTNSYGYNISPGYYWLNFSNPVNPPVAGFTGSPLTGMPPLSVSFLDTSTFATGWAWFFHDETYNQSWTVVNVSSGWSRRFQHSTVSLHDGVIILTGGFDNVNRFNDTWKSINYGKTWTLINASSGWSARQGHLTVLMQDGSIVLMGGYDGSLSKNDTWRSTDEGLTWTLVNGSSGWQARFGLTGIAVQDPSNSIVIMGGSNGTRMNDVWQSTNYGATWIRMNSSAGWEARYYAGSVVMQDGSIVIMGGASSSFYNDVWRSTDKGATWIQQTPGASWGARYRFATVRMPDDSIVLMGGTPVGGNEVWQSRDYGVTWTLVNPSANWAWRSGHTSVIMPNCSIMVFGGFNGVATYLNDTWLFNPVGSTLQNPTHSFSTGSSDISLRVYNFNGYNTTARLAYINVAGPISLFSITPNPAPITSTVSFTDMSSNGPSSWNWIFGDGSVSTSQNPTHIYSSIGVFTVWLNVSNIYGSSNNSQVVTISSSTPIANFTVDHNIGSVPLNITFSDISTGSGITSWYWTFDDGSTSTLQNPVHNYTSLGTYSVQLTVSNPVGTNVSQPQVIYVVNSAIPIVNFIGNPVSGSAPLSVQFIDQSIALNPINAWNWSFGDGNYSNSQNPVHIYSTSGQYHVQLTATSGAFSNYTLKYGYINIGILSSTVTANYVASPIYAANYPQIVQFTDTSICSPVCTNWAWDFNGDGLTDSVLRNPSYNYTYPGNYSPKLIVSNGLNSGTKIRNGYIVIGPIFVAPTITQPTEIWRPGYHNNTTMFAFKGTTYIDVQNSTFLKYWLQNFTATGNFSVYGFATGMMAPIMHVFGFWIFLIIWGLYLFAVWIRSQDVTLPLIIGILTMGTFGLLFPVESLPVIIVMFVICGAIIITKLMKDAI